jgi:hypothetical protein
MTEPPGSPLLQMMIDLIHELIGGTGPLTVKKKRIVEV